MHILGIDYGRRKIGIAIGETESRLAQPYMVIRSSKQEEAIKKVEQVIQVERVGKVVVGVSEGEMEKETRVFGRLLQEKVGVPVSFHDETLTTHEAQELSIKAGIRRKKRKGMEDAYAASVMLQNYLENHK
jgi:putative holliday junction resolvase